MTYDNWRCRSDMDENPEMQQPDELCTGCGNSLLIGEIMRGVCDRCVDAQTEAGRQAAIEFENQALGRLWNDIRAAEPTAEQRALVDLERRTETLYQRYIELLRIIEQQQKYIRIIADHTGVI